MTRRIDAAFLNIKTSANYQEKLNNCPIDILVVLNELFVKKNSHH